MLLDPNTWSTDNTVSLGTWVPSWDGKKVVFAERPNAADEATLYVLDVDTGERSKIDVIPGGEVREPRPGRPTRRASLRVAADGPEDPRLRAARLLRAAPARPRHRPGEGPAAAREDRRPEDLPGRRPLARRQVALRHASRAAGTRTTSSSSGSARTRPGSLLVPGKDAKYGVDVVEGRLLRLHRRGRAQQARLQGRPRRTPSARRGRSSSPRTRTPRARASRIVGGHLAHRLAQEGRLAGRARSRSTGKRVRDGRAARPGHRLEPDRPRGRRRGLLRASARS